MRKRSRYRPKYQSQRGWSENKLLGTEPWRISASLDPIEQILDQIERHGTVDSARGEAVFRDAGHADYYSAVPALRGVIEFFESAAKRKGWPLDLAALTRLGNKLDVSCPLVDPDIRAARDAIDAIRVYAPKLTLGEADDLVKTVRIRQEFERLQVA